MAWSGGPWVRKWSSSSSAMRSDPNRTSNLARVRGDRRIAWALVATLAAGAVLRLLLVLAWKPAFFGWPDAASYIGVSQSGDFFRNELRPAGYPLVLRAMNEISPTLLFVVLVHHLLGLASAAIMFFTVARTGISRRLALLPAAVMALGAPVFFMEHSANSEAVFILLMSISLYCGVRTTEGTSLWWPALGGLVLATAASVRGMAPAGGRHGGRGARGLRAAGPLLRRRVRSRGAHRAEPQRRLERLRPRR